MKNKIYYERNLPHYQPPGQIFFVTWSLRDAMPKQKRILLQDEFYEKKKNITDKLLLDIENRIYFKKMDELLHENKRGNHYLKDRRLSEIVANSIKFWDNKRMELISYCIMSNHVHLVLKMYYKNENGEILYLRNVLESIKKYSAKECNKIIGKAGNKFWEYESYDRLVRDTSELYRIIKYVLDNPVKAGLCENKSDWEFSYIKEEYNEFM